MFGAAPAARQGTTSSYSLAGVAACGPDGTPAAQSLVVAQLGEYLVGPVLDPVLGSVLASNGEDLVLGPSTRQASVEHERHVVLPVGLLRFEQIACLLHLTFPVDFGFSGCFSRCFCHRRVGVRVGPPRRRKSSCRDFANVDSSGIRGIGPNEVVSLQLSGEGLAHHGEGSRVVLPHQCRRLKHPRYRTK